MKKDYSYDFGFEAMKGFNQREIKKCADVIVKNNITPNLDNDGGWVQ